MQIERRTKILLTSLKVPVKQISLKSNIKINSWHAALNGRQRMTTDMIEFLSQMYPNYAYWLATGDSKHPIHKSPCNRDILELIELKALNFAKAVTESTYILSIQYDLLAPHVNSDCIIEMKKHLKKIFNQDPFNINSLERNLLVESVFFNTLKSKNIDIILNNLGSTEKDIERYFQQKTNFLLSLIKSFFIKNTDSYLKHYKIFETLHLT